MCHHNGSFYLYLWCFFHYQRLHWWHNLSQLPFSFKSGLCLVFCLYINLHSFSSKQQTQIHFSDSFLHLDAKSFHNHPTWTENISCFPHKSLKTRQRNTDRSQLHAADVSMYMKCMWCLKSWKQIKSSCLKVPVQNNKLWLDK